MPQDFTGMKKAPGGSRLARALGVLRFPSDNGRYVGLKAAGGLAASFIMELPPDLPTVPSVLTLDSVGQIDHQSIASLTPDLTPYVKTDGSRPLTAAWDAGAFRIQALEFRLKDGAGVGGMQSISGHPVIRDYDGTNRMSFMNTGVARIVGKLGVGASNYFTGGGTAQLDVLPAASTVGVLVKQNATTPGNALEVQPSGSTTPVFQVGPNGRWTTQGQGGGSQYWRLATTTYPNMSGTVLESSDYFGGNPWGAYVDNSGRYTIARAGASATEGLLLTATDLTFYSSGVSLFNAGNTGIDLGAKRAIFGSAIGTRTHAIVRNGTELQVEGTTNGTYGNLLSGRHGINKAVSSAMLTIQAESGADGFLMYGPDGGLGHDFAVNATGGLGRYRIRNTARTALMLDASTVQLDSAGSFNWTSDANGLLAVDLRAKRGAANRLDIDGGSGVAATLNFPNTGSKVRINQFTGPTGAPLEIQSDASGNCFALSQSATEYVMFQAGGVQKGMTGAGALPFVISNVGPLRLSGGSPGIDVATTAIVGGASHGSPDARILRGAANRWDIDGGSGVAATLNMANNGHVYASGFHSSAIANYRATYDNLGVSLGNTGGVTWAPSTGYGNLGDLRNVYDVGIGRGAVGRVDVFGAGGGVGALRVLGTGTDYLELVHESGTPTIRAFDGGIGNSTWKPSTLTPGNGWTSSGPINSVGQIIASTGLVSGATDLGAPRGSVYLDAATATAPFVRWRESSIADRGTLGFAAGSSTLQYRAGATSMADGTQVWTSDTSNFAFKTDVLMRNADALKWNDLAGNAREILSVEADDHVYLSAPPAKDIIARTNTTERLRVAGADGVITHHAAAVSSGGGRIAAFLRDTTAMAAGVGGGIAFSGKFDSAGTYAAFAGIHGEKANATDGNYAGRVVLTARASGGNLIEALRAEASGSTPSIGFLGAAAVARQTVGAAASGGSTVDAEARTSLAAIRTALINLGLCAA